MHRYFVCKRLVVGLLVCVCCILFALRLSVDFICVFVFVLAFHLSVCLSVCLLKIIYFLQSHYHTSQQKLLD